MYPNMKKHKLQLIKYIIYPLSHITSVLGRRVEVCKLSGVAL